MQLGIDIIQSYLTRCINSTKTPLMRLFLCHNGQTSHHNVFSLLLPMLFSWRSKLAHISTSGHSFFHSDETCLYYAIVSQPHPSIHPSIIVIGFVNLTFAIHLSIDPLIHPSIHPSIHRSIHPSIIDFVVELNICIGGKLHRSNKISRQRADLWPLFNFNVHSHRASTIAPLADVLIKLQALAPRILLGKASLSIFSQFHDCKENLTISG